jgi:hypothetical protein
VKKIKIKNLAREFGPERPFIQIATEGYNVVGIIKQSRFYQGLVYSLVWQLISSSDLSTAQPFIEHYQGLYALKQQYRCVLFD